MWGCGTFKWVNGKKYDGQYVNNKKCGFGMFRWPDGSEFKGLWRDGRQNGPGIFLNKKGEMLKGVWENGIKLKHISADMVELAFLEMK